ncbi:uncharacterized protein LOC134268271 [Saccostrea cucullata]|uniref:uncharacterized protein LOC134268271 n=1 Tax=Saccostrea cuccullata TaxID=36930 RepID=UPI002ED68B45
MNIPELFLAEIVVLAAIADGFHSQREFEIVGETHNRTLAALICSKQPDYRLLFFQNLKDFDSIDKKLDRTIPEKIEIWTDLDVLNTTTLKSQVTGSEYSYQFSSLSYVVLVWHPGGLFLRKSNCENGCLFICRDVTKWNSTIVTKKETIDRLDTSTTRYPNDGRGSQTTDNPAQNCSVCDCKTRTFATMTTEEVRGAVNRIRKNLTVVKANLSSNIRKRVSASDPRMSSQIIGMTLGVSILSFVSCLLVIPDIITFLKFLISRVCC